MHREALKRLITPERELVRRGSRFAKILGLILIVAGFIAAMLTAVSLIISFI